MATQVPREHVIGNFRPSISERVKKKPSAQERREGNSEKHKLLIRLLPCCASGKRAPSDPHHLLSGPAGKERGVGMKATDRWLVPLSREKHDELHRLGARREQAWFAEHGIADVYELANALWHATGDLKLMEKVLRAHMNR